MQKIEGDTIVNIKNRVKNKLPVKLVAKLKSVYLNKKGIVKATASVTECKWGKNKNILFM